jgi:hypothetical protein
VSDWIKRAIKRPGAFRAKAEEAGESTSEYASEVVKRSHSKGGSKPGETLLRQAILARTLGKLRRKRGSGGGMRMGKDLPPAASKTPARPAAMMEDDD